MPEIIQLEAQVPDSQAGDRLDQVAARLFEEYSRSRLQSWIKDGSLLVDGKQCRPRDKVASGAKLSVNAESEQEITWKAQDIDLDVVYEDESIIVINKPAGLVVHPAAGHADGTLVNELLNHAPALDQLPLGGIVHRLDMDTSGIMVIPLNKPTHAHISRQFQERKVEKSYIAVVYGQPDQDSGRIDLPIAPDWENRPRQVICAERGKQALTHYQVLSREDDRSRVLLQPVTGRSHQLRIHMRELGHPILGCDMYAHEKALKMAPRLMLHATEIGLEHPTTGKWLSGESPADF